MGEDLAAYIIGVGWLAGLGFAAGFGYALIAVHKWRASRVLPVLALCLCVGAVALPVAVVLIDAKQEARRHVR